MRIVIAPDCFGQVLDAPAAAGAIAAGWLDAAPRDELDLVPLSDGGPGFVAAMHAAIGGELCSAYVSDPLRRQVKVEWLRRGDDAWIESAQACGLHLLAPGERDPGRTTTRGVGELLLLATAGGARRCVVGLGGSGTTDGGAGAWAALGAEPAASLTSGGAGLAALSQLIPPERHGAAELLVATDVDNPLHGPSGAAAVFGPQKGAGPDQVRELDDALRHWADLVEPTVGRPGLRNHPGAGAAGGLGFGLLAVGGRRAIGAALVAEAVGLEARLVGADLVITGEGRLDGQSVRGKVPSAVIRAAQRAGIPCLVIAGEVGVGEREAAAWGIDAAYSVAALAGSVEAGLASGALGVQGAARQAARDWSH